MLRRLLLFLPAVALVAAHAATLPAGLRGELIYSRPYSSDLYPELRQSALVGRYLAAAVEQVRSVGDAFGFLLERVWKAPVLGEAFNMGHMVLLWWPLNVVLDVGPSLVAQALIMLFTNALAGAWLGHRLGGTTAAVIAAGAIAGGSGLFPAVLTSGQIPQAWLAPSLLFAASLPGAVRGSKQDAILGAIGLGVSTHLYWYHGLMLGMLAGLWALVTLLVDRGSVSRDGLVRSVLAGAIVVALLVPAAIPVLGGQIAPDGRAMVYVAPWGTPFPEQGSDTWRALAGDGIVLDQVPTDHLFALGRGWIPALPLLPLVLLGLRRRSGWPWLAVAAMGLVLMIGPAPVDARTMESRLLSGGDLGSNPVAQAAFQWVPLYSRMIHPRRMALVAVCGFAALAALGARELQERRGARLPVVLAAAGLGWVVLVGPLPLKAWPFPGRAADALEACAAVVHAPYTSRFPHAVIMRSYLAMLHTRPWVPEEPEFVKAGATDPLTHALEHDPALRRLAEGAITAPDEARAVLRAAGPGVCLVADTWSPEHPAPRAALEAALGAPEIVTIPGSAFPDTGDKPVALAVWRSP